MRFILKTGILFLGLMMTIMTGAVLLTPPQAQAYEGYRAHRHPGHRGYVRVLPRHHHMTYHGGLRYYVSGGVWYRPWGGRFVIVAPPVGFVVPFLPPYYETVHVNGVPYYYANDVYYVQSPNGYRIVNPPQGDRAPAPASPDQPFSRLPVYTFICFTPY